MTNDLETIDERGELTAIEANARAQYEAAAYVAQAAWHNSNEKLNRDFQDGCEDNATRFRVAMTKAQRAYRDATADLYAE
jgi:hypothetical protein